MKLEARGITRRIGARTLFANLSLELGDGEALAVLGPSGAGKTLLLRLLAWLDPPDGGYVTFDGRLPGDWGVPRWRSLVTYVPQRPPVLPGSPAEHAARVAVLAMQRHRPAEDARELAGRWGLAEEQWRRPWHDLSGGEAQRAQLAIAVSRRPDVLLLDEPTSSLDPEATARVEQALWGRAAIWVTHDRAQAERVASRILELS